jgi:acyl-CoA reductase-like NAD-dependent aldehyde dehydrogenase
VTRLEVRKTYKLYIGGKFPRSESGRSYQVNEAKGGFVANVAQGSRKDARDAVLAARSALAGWSGATAYNRGQVLYRVAEVMEGRRSQFVDEVATLEGLSRDAASSLVDTAIDRWVWYAGWSDKIGHLAGGANPVAGPFFNLSVPEPTGVIAALAPQESSLLGLVSVLAPIIVTGNTVVLISSQDRPLPAVTLAECLATSDVPGGVVNVITGRTAEIAEHLAAHADVNGLDLAGAAPEQLVPLQVLAADTLKRVLAPAPGAPPVDWTATPGLERMLPFLETKTVWHPKGV